LARGQYHGGVKNTAWLTYVTTILSWGLWVPEKEASSVKHVLYKDFENLHQIRKWNVYQDEAIDKAE
jgi:hypothetical protein